MEATTLAKLPAGSEIYPAGLSWSRWGSDLALVDSGNGDRWFDPASMTRLYIVRFAINAYDRSRYNAPRQTDLGVRIVLHDDRVPYDQAVWTIGRSGYGGVRGTFAPVQHFRVAVTLADLDKDDRRILQAWLREQGYTEIATQKPAKAVRALLARAFSDLQADRSEIANEADRILNSAGCNTGSVTLPGCDRIWADLRQRGVYTCKRDGSPKWILRPEA